MNCLNLHITLDNNIVKEFREIPEGVSIAIDRKIIEYPNAFLYQGLTDSHGHISALGSKLNGINLNNSLSAEDCAWFAKKSQKNRGDWILANGWNNELWDANEFPDKSVLDYYFPNNPVCFIRVDGHSAWVNSKALELASISSNAKSPAGGRIELDQSGFPNGILHDNALDLMKNIIPKRTKDDLRNDIMTACNDLLRVGIVNVHDMDVHPELIKVFKELDGDDLLPIKIQSYVSGHYKEWLNYREEVFSGNNFFIKGVKFYADGSLGSRSAAMIEDYSDKAGERGIFLTTSDELFLRASIAVKQGFQVAVHAIGDAANRMVINQYKRLHDEKIAKGNSILRLEHAQHISNSDLDILGKYNIISSIQPIHCISDVATITEKRVGKRIVDAYRWKSIVDNGGLLISGSDFPIESQNPFLGIDALINRIPRGYNESWNADEKIDLDYALNSYTQFPEKITNSINPFDMSNFSKIDNFIIVNQKLDSINSIKDTRVLAAYQNKKFNNYI